MIISAIARAVRASWGAFVELDRQLAQVEMVTARPAPAEPEGEEVIRAAILAHYRKIRDEQPARTHRSHEAENAHLWHIARGLDCPRCRRATRAAASDT